jgi:hypothetical protein
MLGGEGFGLSHSTGLQQGLASPIDQLDVLLHPAARSPPISLEEDQELGRVWRAASWMRVLVETFGGDCEKGLPAMGRLGEWD